MNKYRIVQVRTTFYIEEYSGIFFKSWKVLKEDGGFDPLGFPYPDYDKPFKTAADAFRYISEMLMPPKKKVIAEIEINYPKV